MINLKKLAKIEELALKNALRLHYDAMSLFKIKSYPSAYFLSVLSQEEIGKARILDDIVWYSMPNEDMPEGWKQIWVDRIFDHGAKQKQFILQGGIAVPDYRHELYDKDFFKKVFSGGIEQLKQNSIYVGLPRHKKKTEIQDADKLGLPYKKAIADLRGKICSPFNVKREKAEKQITVVNDFLIDYIMGIIYGYYTWDNENISRFLNKNLLKRLETAWQFKSHKLCKKIKILKKQIKNEKIRNIR